jgi:hypothetical protein
MNKAIIGSLVATALLATSVTAASADRWHGRGYRGGYSHGCYRCGPGPVLGLVGAVVVGAATIATLPFRAVGAIVAPPPPGPDYYGPPAPPPPPPPGYYGRGYYGGGNGGGYYGDGY